tara:strand:- start:287 stop:721 length:435 start_codon:yes stop_codon:yes gene_type:complete
MVYEELLMSKYGVGLRNVGSYQVSGQPFVTGSDIVGNLRNTLEEDQEVKVSFPYVAKNVKIWNWSSDNNSVLRVHLVSSSSIANHPTSKHFFRLAKDEEISLDFKCKELYLSAINGDAQWKLYASLTNISTGHMYELTGSGVTT